MTRSIFAVILILLCFIAVVPGQKKTIILVRHAEKVDASQDPELSPEGRQRAERLMRIVKKYRPGAIYSTDFKRTRDTAAPMAARRKLRIETYDARPIRHIINTHGHMDHVAGNALLAEAGDELFASAANGFAPFQPGQGSAPIYAHENVLVRLSSMEPPLSFESWPSSTYFTESKDLYFNGEAVRLFHAPSAHTDGDTIVQFRGSDVLSTGDIFDITRYPYIDVESGGSIDGIIAALNHVIEIAVPEALQEGGTLIVPGRGRLCDESEVVEYRDMLTLIRSMIQERIDEGMTLAEVQAARPTFGFDVRYESDDRPARQFVEVIYNELVQQRNN
jgi:glyoxylase-like metal-dependent hydrolase (beta-lactamase superfamily II)